VSSLSFTLVIHTVTLKLFLETRNWTYVALIIGFLSVLFYYISVIVLNTESVSSVFQPEAN